MQRCPPASTHAAVCRCSPCTARRDARRRRCCAVSIRWWSTFRMSARAFIPTPQPSVTYSKRRLDRVSRSWFSIVPIRSAVRRSRDPRLSVASSASRPTFRCPSVTASPWANWLECSMRRGRSERTSRSLAFDTGSVMRGSTKRACRGSHRRPTCAVCKAPCSTRASPRSRAQTYRWAAVPIHPSS